MKAVLCYVREPWAYFTTQNLKDQWGDDWNDAPYEHNAGEPYGDRDGRWKIIKVAFEGDFDSPCSAVANSRWSVEDINRGNVPWLETSRYYRESPVSIWAGMPLDEFVKLVKQCGGTVYLSDLGIKP